MDTPLQHHSNYGDLLEILVYLGRYVQESFPVEQKSLRAHCKYNVSSFLVEIVFNIFFSLLYSTVGTSTASILPCEILFSPQGLKAGLHRCQLEHSQPIQLLAFIWNEGTIPQRVRDHNLNSGCRRSNLTQQKQSLPHTKKSPLCCGNVKPLVYKSQQPIFLVWFTLWNSAGMGRYPFDKYLLLLKVSYSYNNNMEMLEQATNRYRIANLLQTIHNTSFTYSFSGL